MSGECRFDLKPLHCAKCGAFIGQLGTCDDVAYCGKCDSAGLKPSQDDDTIIGVDTVYQPEPDQEAKHPMQRVNLTTIGERK